MKCNNCSNEINTKWQHAISENLCPFCGKSIMDEELQKLLVDIKPLILKLETDFSQAWLEWIDTNFSFIKRNSEVQPLQVKINTKQDKNIQYDKNENIIIPMPKDPRMEKLKEKIIAYQNNIPIHQKIDMIKNPDKYKNDELNNIMDESDIETDKELEEEESMTKKIMEMNQRIKK
jgi:Zn-finger nucleic acid-binding protein